MAQILLARGLLSRFRSDRPASCELIQKTVQERRKDGGQDQSQDPDGFGVCLWLTGKYYEAGKSDNTRHSTHSKSNKHADDHLLHGISSFILRASKSPAPLICVTPISTFLQNVRLVFRVLYSGTGCRFDFENQLHLGMTPLLQVHPGTQNVSHESLFIRKSDWRCSSRPLSIACAKSLTRAREQRMDLYQFAGGKMLEA